MLCFRRVRSGRGARNGAHRSHSTFACSNALFSHEMEAKEDLPVKVPGFRGQVSRGEPFAFVFIRNRSGKVHRRGTHRSHSTFACSNVLFAYEMEAKEGLPVKVPGF